MSVNLTYNFKLESIKKFILEEPTLLNSLSKALEI